MEIIIIILLVIIAYILWRIYRQKEEEKELINRAELMVEDEKSEVEWEKEQKEKFKKYPHLLGNIDYTLLELYGELYVEKGWPHLQMAFAKYVDVANNTSPGIDDAELMIKGEKRIKQRMKLKKPLDLIKVSVISNANDLKIDGDFLLEAMEKK